MRNWVFYSGHADLSGGLQASQPQFADVAFNAGNSYYGHVYLVPLTPAQPLRSAIGFVAFDGTVFRGTLAENIRYKRPQATLAETRDAALAAGLGRGSATSAEDVARLLWDRKSKLLVTDPPYGIELDTEWRDRAGLNSCGPAACWRPNWPTVSHG